MSFNNCYQGTNSPDELVSFQTSKLQTFAHVKSEFTFIMYQYSLSRAYDCDSRLEWLLEHEQNPYLFSFLFKTYFASVPPIFENYDRSSFIDFIRSILPGEFTSYIQDKGEVEPRGETPLQSVRRLVSGNLFTVLNLEKECERSNSSLECADEVVLEVMETHEEVVEEWAKNAAIDVVIYAPPHSGKTTLAAEVNAEVQRITNSSRVVIHDTDDILNWTVQPKIVVTNVSSILKNARSAISFLPSSVEFERRCRLRGLTPLTASADVNSQMLRQWYSDAKTQCETFSCVVYSDDYIGSCYDRYRYFRPVPLIPWDHLQT